LEIGERAENLAVQVIGPLLLGGAIQLQRPFGAKLAMEIGVGRRIVDNDLRSQIDEVRLRVARSVVAIDAMHELSAAEWALACGLNDLLQVTNHELSSFATRGRHAELLDSVRDLCQTVPPCKTLEEAVGRHATFSRALSIARKDTNVSWWTGSESFRGQPPSPRLLAWPGLRNVRIDERPVPFVAMAAGVAIDEGHFVDALATWTACSPLSDIASAHRPTAKFRWTSHTLSLVSTVAGSNLALRALSHATNDDPLAAEAAVQAMQSSAAHLPDGAAKNIAGQFAVWLHEARAHWAEPA